MGARQMGNSNAYLINQTSAKIAILTWNASDIIVSPSATYSSYSINPGQHLSVQAAADLRGVKFGIVISVESGKRISYDVWHVANSQKSKGGRVEIEYRITFNGSHYCVNGCPGGIERQYSADLWCLGRQSGGATLNVLELAEQAVSSAAT
eukprot:c52187_g1_i1.p1 GENE.c52187_g1_i1~~c52187_g1_i1.p1  ORF type:complete len:151 (-),score=19.32 c52187_g1_i1:20-472(-)